MSVEEAKHKLNDKTFLLGRFRRQAAIRILAAYPDPASAVALAEALGSGHPDATRIIAVLQQLSAERDAAKALALWECWAYAPSAPLAGILSRLGWPVGQSMQPETASSIFAAAIPDAAPEICEAVAVFARSQPVADADINDACYTAWAHSRTSFLGDIVLGQKRQPGSAASIIALAEAVGSSHPDAERMVLILHQLSPEADAATVQALWEYWAQAPTVPVAGILAHLGWPPGLEAQAKTVRDILALATSNAAPEILQTVTAFARHLPLADESINDDIYGAWVRSRSNSLEQLISEQKRQPGSPALEALHALVTGELERYAALHDENSHYLIQAYTTAPAPLRERLARAVAASSDRRLMAAYRSALSGSSVDAMETIDDLKRIGDQDGLFEACRTLRLAQVLGLCEYWADHPGRPTGASQRLAVDRAAAACQKLRSYEAQSSGSLPNGLVDIFDWWRTQQPGNEQIQADLLADDPFTRARGLYLGHERGRVDATQIAAAAKSAHWPERLVARMVDPVHCAQTTGDHVFWATACGGDPSLLNAVIGGTPEEYARHCALLAAAQEGKADGRNKALLEILCAFQEFYVGTGISIDKGAEATDRSAIEIEDAPDEVF